VTIRWNGYYQAPIIRHVGKGEFCLMEHKVYYGHQVEDIEKLWNERADMNTKIVVDIDKLCTKIEEDWING